MDVTAATMPGALSSAVAGINAQFARVAEATRRLRPDGDIPAALVEIKYAQFAARANMAVARTADDMQGALLDLLA